jgi:hypothetical protein
VYGYSTLYVADGAAMSATLGVNPSLSITAQAERAASLWPNKGESDQRPRQGEPYRRLDPIAPQHPVVPVDAPGALRWLPIEADQRGGLRPSACDRLQRRAADHPAALPMHIDGHVAHQGDTMHEPILAVVVVDCLVLSCPVVPDGHLTPLPVPSDGVLRRGDSPLHPAGGGLRAWVRRPGQRRVTRAAGIAAVCGRVGPLVFVFVFAGDTQSDVLEHWRAMHLDTAHDIGAED